MDGKGKLTRRVAAAALAGGALGALLAGRPAWLIQFLAELKSVVWPSKPIQPAGLVVHHSATPPWRLPFETVDTIAADHARRGLSVSFEGRVYHIAYHYIIKPDGKVEPGRPELCRGAHTHTRKYNRWLGVCLLGYFDPKWIEPQYHAPTPKQMDALARLAREEMERYGFGPEAVVPHCAVNPTECPGKSFPWEEFMAGLGTGVRLT